MRTPLLLAGLLPLCAFAQNDYFANDPIWRQSSLCNGGGGVGGSCISDKTYNYVLAGDTVANGYTYKKVMRQGTETLYWQGGNPPPPPIYTGTIQFGPEFVAYLRQDGLTIRELQVDIGMEYLVHDFNLNTGDTLPWSTTNWNTDITVGAIDSIQVGTEWRKRFALVNSWAPYLIEGIGSSHGLLEPVSNFFDCGYALECFGLGAVGYYPAPGPDCALAMGTTGPEPMIIDLAVYPNPAMDRLHITGDQPLGPVSLFDAQGRVVAAARAQGSALDLDIHDLPPGLYIASIGNYRMKVIIER